MITRSGHLCEFNEKRLLDKWVELRVSESMDRLVLRERRNELTLVLVHKFAVFSLVFL